VSQFELRSGRLLRLQRPNRDECKPLVDGIDLAQFASDSDSSDDDGAALDSWAEAGAYTRPCFSST
jgi:hypothetical protein